MMEEFKYRVLADSDGDKCSMELNFPGFYETWAYATGYENKTYWEFDLCSKDGLDMHFSIPYTLSNDVLQTMFIRCVDSFNKLDKS